MIASRRIFLVLPVLLLALTISMVGAGTAFADEGDEYGAYCQEMGGDGEGCPDDQCPSLEGYQYSTSMCPAPDPAPAPTPVPEQPQAPVDACPEVDGVQTDAAQCLPDEAPAPGVEVEASSLTLQTVQHDPAPTIGGEQTVAAAPTSAGGVSAAVTTASGDLPYTGSPTILVAILAVSLLWLGSIAWIVGSVIRRRSVAPGIAA